jgi:hypothetical protein
MGKWSDQEWLYGVMFPEGCSKADRLYIRIDIPGTDLMKGSFADEDLVSVLREAREDFPGASVTVLVERVSVTRWKLGTFEPLNERTEV